MTPDTTIYLIRHGKSLANKKGVFAGRTEDHLIPEGRSQVEKLAKELKGRKIKKIYSSPVTRARESADIISSILQTPVIHNENLSDIRIPDWEGRFKKDLMKDKACGYHKWKDAPDQFFPHNGEGLRDLQKRASRFIINLFQQHTGEEIAVVTHLAVARCIVLTFSGRELSNYREIEISNSSPLALSGNSTHIFIKPLK